ncbi:MAG: Holliday junction branch migration protein RuvA [Blastocatellia bacterium]
MIANLRGILIEKQPTYVIVEAGGIGYEVWIPLSTFYQIGEVGAEVSLRTYTSVREDAIQLFGFSTARERELYIKLISVQGIGVRSAISMLSGMDADEIITALKNNDLAKLTAIPGVGRKTAERLVIELRDKVAEIGPQQIVRDDKAAAATDRIYDDALSALLNLGYQKSAAEKALRAANNEVSEPNVQRILRAALRNLAR